MDIENDLEYLYKMQEEEDEEDSGEEPEESGDETALDLGKRGEANGAKKNVAKGRKKVKLNIEFEEDEDNRELQENEALKETRGFN